MIAAVHFEIFALSCLLVGVFGLRRWFGLAPLYAVLGLLISWMMVGGRLRVEVPLLTGEELSWTSTVHLPLIMSILVLVYALEGTTEARKAIAAVALANLAQIVFRLLLAWHLTRDGVDLEIMGRDRWSTPSAFGATVSTLALVSAGVGIIVVYQAFRNTAPWIPQVVVLSLALLVAVVIDAVVFGSLYGRFDLAIVGNHVTGKLSAGAVAAVPVGLFLAWNQRRGEIGDELVAERGAFEIVRLRRRVLDTEEALERTRAEYDQVKDIFSRYVAPDVVEEILDDTHRIQLGGELREVTILFSDIRGYSTLSEALSPVETIELLNEYFTAMSHVINRHRGTIIEFEGDAILCVFGAPLVQPDHARRAVQTGIEMLARIEELNRQWDADGTSETWRSLHIASFKIRLGIHTGPVVVGNVGSETRTKYAVIGDTVNAAHRIESLNKTLRTTLLMSETTLEALTESDPNHELEPIDLGSHQVKGRKEPLHVFTLEGLPGLDRLSIPEHEPVSRTDLAQEPPS